VGAPSRGTSIFGGASCTNLDMSMVDGIVGGAAAAAFGASMYQSFATSGAREVEARLRRDLVDGHAQHLGIGLAVFAAITLAAAIAMSSAGATSSR